MTKYQIKEYNCETQQEIVRDANDEETSRIKAQIQKEKILLVEAEAKEAAKAAILDRIGLTADELKTILG